MTALLIRDSSPFDLIVTTNMYVDILFDEASELSGSLGLGCIAQRRRGPRRRPGAARLRTGHRGQGPRPSGLADPLGRHAAGVGGRAARRCTPGPGGGADRGGSGPGYRNTSQPYTRSGWAAGHRGVHGQGGRSAGPDKLANASIRRHSLTGPTLLAAARERTVGLRRRVGAPHPSAQRRHSGVRAWPHHITHLGCDAVLSRRIARHAAELDATEHVEQGRIQLPGGELPGYLSVACRLSPRILHTIMRLCSLDLKLWPISPSCLRYVS